MNKQRLATFLEMLEEETDNCIEWKFSIASHGYGMIWHEGKDKTVHRLALTLKVGQPPQKRMLALHKPKICNNRLCFNYRHLYWGTWKDNSRDAVTDGTFSKPPRFVGEEHPRAKLTKNQVIEIRADSDSQRKIAKKYGVNHTTIGFIKRYEHWKEIA